MNLFKKLVELIEWLFTESAEVKEFKRSQGELKEVLMKLEDERNEKNKERIKRLEKQIKWIELMIEVERRSRKLYCIRLGAFSLFGILFLLIAVGFYTEIVVQETYRWIFGSYFLLAVICSVVHYWRAPKYEADLIKIVNDHEELKRALRKEKKKQDYGKQRRKALAKQIELDESVRSFDSSDDIDKLEKQLEPIVGKMTEIESMLDPIKDNIQAVKEFRTGLENFLVCQCYMPFVAFVAFSVIFSIFFFISLSNFGENVTAFRYLMEFFYSAVVLFGVYYLLSSRKEVTRTDRGVKFFRDKPYKIITRGPRLAARWLVSIVEITTEVQRYDMAPIKAKIADREKKGDKHSQVVFIDASILFHLERPIDAITELGLNMEAIFKKLTGSENLKIRAKPKPDDPDEPIGIITDLISSYVRAYIAEWVKTLDAAYKIQDELAVELSDLLKEYLEYLGIRIDNVFITDVRGTDQIEQARNLREEASIGRDTAEINAGTKIKTAKGTAEETRLIGVAESQVKLAIGKAEAEVKTMMGEAEANVAKAKIIAKIEGITSIDESTKQIAIKAVPLLMAAEFGKEIIPQAAQALSNTTFNVFTAEILEVVKKVLGGFSLFSDAKAPVGGGS